MRRTTRTLILALGLASAATTRLPAEDGTLTVEVQRATANAAGKDDWTNQQQDFFVRYTVDGAPRQFVGKISDRDDAAFTQNNTFVKIVPNKNQRFFDFYFELWDDDSCDLCGDNPPDDFDISPQNGPPPLPFITWDPSFPSGGFPHVTYDVCTGAMSVNGIFGSSPIPIGSNYAALSGIGTTSGTNDNWATLKFEVHRSPGNWLPEDVAVTKVQIVQAVYNATRAVVDKPTSMRVDVYSTYPTPLLNIPLFGQMTDGITTVADAKSVTINTGANTYFLFDGTNNPPFRPWKPITANSATVSGFARVDYTEHMSLNAPPQLMDCYNINNTGQATALALSRTVDPKVVYERFDYLDNEMFITDQQNNDMFQREETFRLASWPLANLNSSKSPHLNATPHDYLAFEPAHTLLDQDQMASLAKIDRLVLSVRKGWFNDNAHRHQFIASDITGYSLGPVLPHAVLAEDQSFANAVHELGHTFSQSQHECHRGGFLQSALNLSCMDEYLNEPPDDNPYEARGFDVEGHVYPNGTFVTSGYPGIQCPGGTPVGRDVCAANLMDANPRVVPGANPPTTYANWVDDLTYDQLFKQLHAGTDPLLLLVSGTIYMPQGAGDGITPPLVFGELRSFSYQTMGIPDMLPAPLSPNGEQFSGSGAFRIRLRTPQGVHDYRFNALFLDSTTSPEQRAFFSLRIPFDPATFAVELISPANLLDLNCQNRYCPGNEMPLFGMGRSPLPPGVANLRAGLDTAPPGIPPSPPIIPPGHDAVVAWSAADPDSPETRAALLVWRQDPGGPAGDLVPVGINVDGGSLHIPQGTLADTPGMYYGQVVVTDGINTTELNSGPLFSICNFSNGGVEVCNGLDEDCDGVLDDASPPPSQSVALNPHPLPPGGATIDWNPDPQAQTYDVVYGLVGTLRSTGGNFTLAVSGCLAENNPGTSLAVDPVPPVGEAYFYLVRGNNCGGAGTWDSGAASQIGSRDGEIAANPNACQP